MVVEEFIPIENWIYIYICIHIHLTNVYTQNVSKCVYIYSRGAKGMTCKYWVPLNPCDTLTKNTHDMPISALQGA